MILKFASFLGPKKKDGGHSVAAAVVAGDGEYPVRLLIGIYAVDYRQDISDSLS